MYACMFLFYTTLGLSSKDVLEYLEKGPKEAMAAAAVARSALRDDHMKMLNLTHDWLNSLIPFCLMKIDRVSIELHTITHFSPVASFLYVSRSKKNTKI